MTRGQRSRRGCRRRRTLGLGDRSGRPAERQRAGCRRSGPRPREASAPAGSGACRRPPISFTSDLKIRIERPRLRAASGSLLGAERRTHQHRQNDDDAGAPRFLSMGWSPLLSRTAAWRSFVTDRDGRVFRGSRAFRARSRVADRSPISGADPWPGQLTDRAAEMRDGAAHRGGDHAGRAEHRGGATAGTKHPVWLHPAGHRDARGRGRPGRGA